MPGEAGREASTRRLELVADPADGLAVALTAGARARDVDGDLRASRQSFERAYQLAGEAGDAQAMALAALGLAGLWVSERRTVTGAVQLEAATSTSPRRPMSCSARTPACQWSAASASPASDRFIRPSGSPR